MLIKSPRKYFLLRSVFPPPGLYQNSYLQNTSEALNTWEKGYVLWTELGGVKWPSPAVQLWLHTYRPPQLLQDCLLRLLREKTAFRILKKIFKSQENAWFCKGSWNQSVGLQLRAVGRERWQRWGPACSWRHMCPMSRSRTRTFTTL